MDRSGVADEREISESHRIGWTDLIIGDLCTSTRSLVPLDDMESTYSLDISNRTAVFSEIFCSPPTSRIPRSNGIDNDVVGVPTKLDEGESVVRSSQTVSISVDLNIAQLNTGAIGADSVHRARLKK